MNKKIKVLGSGAAIVDILSCVDDSFLPNAGGQKGGMNLIDTGFAENLLSKLPEYSKELGGSTGNTMFGLLQLGIPCSMLAKIGHDPEGKFYINRFRDLGGTLTSFKYSSAKNTGRCICLVTPDSERTMRTDLGASSDLLDSDILDSDFENISHLHVEGYQLFNESFFDELMQHAKKHAVTISLDLASYEVVNLFRDRIEGLLRDYVDVVFANEDEAAAFFKTGKINPENSVKALLELCGTAVVKLGSKGAVLGRSGEPTVFVPAKKVHAIDTTGAGDLWQAGFLYGWLNGKPLNVCGEMGNILGAEVVQVLGGAIPADRWPIIKETFNKF